MGATPQPSIPLLSRVLPVELNPFRNSKLKKHPPNGPQSYMCGETRGNDLQPGHLSLVVDLGGVVLRLDKHGTKYIFSKENLCIIITMSLFSGPLCHAWSGRDRLRQDCVVLLSGKEARTGPLCRYSPFLPTQLWSQDIREGIVN